MKNNKYGGIKKSQQLQHKNREAGSGGQSFDDVVERKLNKVKHQPSPHLKIRSAFF